MAMKLYCKILYAKSKIKDWIESEQGDTNFISIIVILGIVLALAATFSGKITELVNQIWTKVGESSSKVLNNM